MPEEKEPPRPHGDKLAAARQDQTDRDDNQAQQQSDAPPDVIGSEETDRDHGRGSTANGVPAFDEDDGALRKRQYRDGADLVSGLD